MDVQLDNFLACKFARVRNIHRDCDSIHIFELTRRRFGIAVFKGGIAQTMTEREQHRHLLGIVITIADEDTFTVADLARTAGPIDMRWCI